MRRLLPCLLLVIAVVLTACGDDEPQSAPRPARSTGDPTGAPTDYEQYVALGDSYTSAPLVPPTDTSTTCLRSEVNYPALVAQRLAGTELTDVSCGGATSADMITAQHGSTGSVPPQFDALRTGTDLVTIGIGGNDEGLFGTLLATCTQLAGTDPTGAPCTQKFADRLDPVLRQIQKNVADVAAGVRQRSPRARILVVGYPQIVPASGTCDDLPLAVGDYPFARRVNEGLTDAVQAAAEGEHVDYVDVWTSSDGHDICADDPWINGRVTSADRALAYHPLAVEQQAVADLVLEELGE